MKKAVRFPIRQKIMLSLLFVLTLAVSLVTFIMANFFHQDKRAYIHDWVSITTVSTADECRSLVRSYLQRLEVYAEIMLNKSIEHADRQQLLQKLFDELPELVSIEIRREGKEAERADDRRVLEEARLTPEMITKDETEHPPPFERIRSGQAFLANATISEELPAFRLAFARDGGDGERSTLVVAYLRADALLRLGAKRKVFEVQIAGSDGVLLAHPDPRQVLARRKADQFDGTQDALNANSAGMTAEFTRQGTEMIGGVAGVDIAGLTVTALVPKTAAYLASRDLLSRLVMVALVLLMVAALCGLLWAHRITRPVERLSRATREIAKGRFDTRLAIESRDEIGALAGSFNQMANELETRDEELETAQSQLIQSEKLAAFGQLGAGIAHEVKNPLAGILACAQLAAEEVAEESQVFKDLKLIEKESKRCKSIIENLLKFARQEKAVFEQLEVNDVVADAAAIVNHQLEMSQVKLHKELSQDVPKIQGNANQLQQVLMNLMINAQQAMEDERGAVTISTRAPDPDHVEVLVSDTGPGIPEEIQSKIFDPFFSTKAIGKGTGLGLSVSFGIIQDHQGTILLDSSVGEGTTFTLRFPAVHEPAPLPADATCD